MRYGLRPEGGKHHFFSFHICERAAEDKQVEKNGSKTESNKINCYTTFKDTSPRNHCAKSQGQRIYGFLSYRPKAQKSCFKFQFY